MGDVVFGKFKGSDAPDIRALLKSRVPAFKVMQDKLGVLITVSKHEYDYPPSQLGELAHFLMRLSHDCVKLARHIEEARAGAQRRSVNEDA